LELTPGMSAGAPAAPSKKTLCGTEPNANVAVPPATMFSGDGLKVRFGVASTVPLAGGGDDDVADSVAAPPQAARRARQIKEVVRSMILSERVYVPDGHQRRHAGGCHRLMRCLIQTVDSRHVTDIPALRDGAACYARCLPTRRAAMMLSSYSAYSGVANASVVHTKSPGVSSAPTATLPNSA